MGRKSKVKYARLHREAQFSRHLERLAVAHTLQREIRRREGGILRCAWRTVRGWCRFVVPKPGQSAKVSGANALQRTR
jgi:hypothetical protein